MKLMYEATATAMGGRNGQVVSEDNVLKLDIRTPKALGGSGGAYSNPEQLFAAGYAACFDSALNLVARGEKVPVKDTKVSATVGIGQLAHGGFGLNAKLKVEIPGIERKLAQQLMEKAHQVCPYSNATRGNIEVELELL